MFTKEEGRRLHLDAQFERYLTTAEETLRGAYKFAKKITPGESWIYIDAGCQIERMRQALQARGFTVDLMPASFALKVYL